MLKNDIPVFDSTKAHPDSLQSQNPKIFLPALILRTPLGIRLSGSGVECSRPMYRLDGSVLEVIYLRNSAGGCRIGLIEDWA
jgi:hypothetical protein